MWRILELKRNVTVEGLGKAPVSSGIAEAADDIGRGQRHKARAATHSLE
jgi:hypothetical protein